MERHDTLIKLQSLVGQDLHDLAKQFGVTVLGANGKVNKGWAGHVFECFLGLPINSSQNPDFGTWELKSIPLKYKGLSELSFKETMAITMIDPRQVATTPFEDSHLYAKLRKTLCVARIVGNDYSEPTVIHSITNIDLQGQMYQQVKADYEEVQACINDSTRGFSALTGKMGTFIQPRTKGPGHGSISRAFYARKSFLAHYINL